MIICNYTYYMFELVHDGGTIFQHILELVSREVMSCQGDLHSTCSWNLCGRLRAGRFCGHVAVAWHVVFGVTYVPENLGQFWGIKSFCSMSGAGNPYDLVRIQLIVTAEVFWWAPFLCILRSAVEMVLFPLVCGVATRAALPLTISKLETYLIDQSLTSVTSGLLVHLSDIWIYMYIYIYISEMNCVRTALRTPDFF